MPEGPGPVADTHTESKPWSTLPTLLNNAAKISTLTEAPESHVKLNCVTVHPILSLLVATAHPLNSLPDPQHLQGCIRAMSAMKQPTKNGFNETFQGPAKPRIPPQPAPRSVTPFPPQTDCRNWVQRNVLGCAGGQGSEKRPCNPHPIQLGIPGKLRAGVCP